MGRHFCSSGGHAEHSLPVLCRGGRALWPTGPGLHQPGLCPPGTGCPGPAEEGPPADARPRRKSGLLGMGSADFMGTGGCYACPPRLPTGTSVSDNT